MINKVKNLLTKGETRPHLIKTFVVYGFVALSIILIKIFIARLYGQEELGIFTYLFGISSFVFLFASFGFPEAITQTIIKEPSKLNSCIKNSIIFMLPITIVSIFLSFYIPFFEGLRDYFGIFVLYLISYFVFYIPYSIFRGRKNFAEGSSYSLLNRILFILFIFFLAYKNFNFNFVLVSFSIAMIIATIISLPRLKNLFKKSSSRDIVNQKKFFYLALSLFLMQVGFYSLRYIDVIFIQYLVDFQSLGLYSAYASVTNAVRLVAYVFPVVVLPMAVINNYKLKDSFKKIMFVLVPFSLLALVVSYVFVPIFYGSNYVGGLLPIALVFSSFLLVVYSYFNSIFVGENKLSKFYFKLLIFDFLVSILVNTGLNFIFILKMGIIGAPIATSIVVFLKILINIYGIKKLRLGKKEAVKEGNLEEYVVNS